MITKLDQKKICKGLKNAVDVEVFETLDSTSSEARRRAADLLRPAVFLSEEQTAGRGRNGHSFYSPKYDGLYCTLAYPADGFGENLLRVTAKAAVAVVSGIQSRLNLALQIKWVNDIY
ncbi:MAG: biotin--[acetyl-CoA-carboxylase] ligase, partial [Lachnospiraceae bacterium]|nr:biotin--[acetyl-CoA-carboxylase] ligase [Lachnospiraceae bacterium]